MGKAYNFMAPDVSSRVPPKNPFESKAKSELAGVMVSH
jgi:hypothetical protein